MEKLRDIIYNKSDILVTLLILIIAGLLIAWRVSAIMSYGVDDEAGSSDIDNGAGIVNSSTLVNDETTDEAIAAGETTDDAISTTTEEGSSTSEGTTQTETSGVVSIVVEKNDTADAIAAKLVAAGLITDKQVFLYAVSTAGADTRLKAGTFDIYIGMTPEQIVEVFTS